MADLDDRIAELVAELDLLNATINRIMAGGQHSTLEAESTLRINYGAALKRRAQIIRSIQRLKYGGRAVAVDVSQGGATGISMWPTNP